MVTTVAMDIITISMTHTESLQLADAGALGVACLNLCPNLGLCSGHTLSLETAHLLFWVF